MEGNGLQELAMIVGTLVACIVSIPLLLLFGSKDVGPDVGESKDHH